MSLFSHLLIIANNYAEIKSFIRYIFNPLAAERTVTNKALGFSIFKSACYILSVSKGKTFPYKQAPIKFYTCDTCIIKLSL